MSVMYYLFAMPLVVTVLLMLLGDKKERVTGMWIIGILLATFFCLAASI